MTLRLYNTLSRSKELFEPVVPGKVGVYLCGPTVYKPSHVGHAVGPVIFDVLVRYLKFKGFFVRFVINVTDVDDKLITEAAAQNTSVMELARTVEASYRDGLKSLGITTVDVMPRVSEHMPEIIDAIATLVEKGHAYAAEGNVYFDVSSDDDYGKLSNRNVEEMRAATRNNLVENGKRNPGDFALWKAAKPDEPSEVRYDSPWGSGRPGWHIECSAMSMKYLGDTLDIHGGGTDLIFPHHENEIAQSECATGKPFTRYWMHNGLTRFNTKKISKSDADMQAVMSKLMLGNLLAALGPELLRYTIISSHYRSPLDFSDETVNAARKGLSSFYRLFERVERLVGRSAYELTSTIDRVENPASGGSSTEFRDLVLNRRLRFLEAMDDDLNTAGAIAALYEIATGINRYIETTRLETVADAAALRMVEAACGTLVNLARLLGLFTAPIHAAAAGDDGTLNKVMQVMIETRQRARAAKQFELADYIRDALDGIGIKLEDRADGTGWRRD